MTIDQNDSRTVQSSFPHALESQVLERVDPQEQLRLGWRIVLTMILLVCIAILGLVTASRARVQAAPHPSLDVSPDPRPHGQSSTDPLVMAFYYTWFDENTWTYDKLSDLPQETYLSRDRAAMGRHIDQAKAAGIDAFLVAWYGPDGQFNQTESNLTALLEEAAARNFKIGILFETDSPFLGGAGAVSGALQHVQNVHAQHPAYLRVDGRPVVFFWRPQMHSVDTWRSIRSQVDPGYGSIWIAEGVDMSFQSVFDGHHLYSNTWNPPNDLGYTNQKFANYVASARDQYGVHKFWVATVMPGYNDTRIRPGGFAQAREGGGYYARAWQAAIDSRPDWIVVNSFNEWPEGTYIEPSAAYGNQFIGLTAQWSGQFKAGGSNFQAAPPAAVVSDQTESVDAGSVNSEPAKAEPEAILMPTPTPAPQTPTAYVEAGLLNVRAGPSTDHEIVAVVANGTALPIRGNLPDDPDWLQIELDGQLAWVFAPLVSALGPLDQIEVVDLTLDSDTPGDEGTAGQSDLSGHELPFYSGADTIELVPTRPSYP